ncbi:MULTISPECIES: DUF5590 domain-containing protein [Bacillales]|uniref:cell wall elongation regulator TseB-like domain-containing protein n=1 Tax=Bacillales TaxID=1385 RepID=UPI0006A7AE87|nr:MULTISPECIES: DUF5590 domain-containing protein [Bacillales]OBZ17532.1 hypothetical protein A7975_06630 [Bacillus sp. FJAT-26390]
MTLKRWIILIALCLVLLITAFFIYFREIQSPHWAAIKDAKEQATKAADLTSIETVYHHIWSKESWIVTGVNQADEKVFVFMTGDKLPEIVKASDGISEQALKNSFKNEKPAAQIKRIQPGLLDDKKVWEVYYDNGQKPQHSLYDFYSFDTGTLVETYTLPAKTGP